MADAKPDFWSPAGPAAEPAEGRGLELSDLTGSPIRTLPVAPPGDEAGVTVGFAVRTGDSVVFAVAPDEWFVLSPPGTVQEGGGIDVTHGRVVYRLTGADAPLVLEKVCALDFDNRFMPDGAAGRTSVAKISCEVVRLDQGDRPSYLIAAGRSFGAYLWEALLDAAAEFDGRAVVWDRRGL